MNKSWEWVGWQVWAADEARRPPAVPSGVQREDNDGDVNMLRLVLAVPGPMVGTLQPRFTEFPLWSPRVRCCFTPCLR